MMHETPEDNMFTDLLGEYAAPIADNGFSAKVLADIQMHTQEANTETRQNLKNFIVGGAAIIGGMVAALQLPALWTYVKGLSVPVVEVPTLDLSSVQTSIGANMATPSYTLAAFAMMAALCIWLASAFIFGDNL